MERHSLTVTLIACAAGALAMSALSSSTPNSPAARSSLSTGTVPTQSAEQLREQAQDRAHSALTPQATAPLGTVAWSGFWAVFDVKPARNGMCRAAYQELPAEQGNIVFYARGVAHGKTRVCGYPNAGRFASERLPR